MQLVTALTVFLALTISHDVYGRLNEKEDAQAEHRLPRGGRGGGGGKPEPSRGGRPSPGQIEKATAGQIPLGQLKKALMQEESKRGPPPPTVKPVPALVMEPVKWKEVGEIPKEQDFNKLLLAQKSLVKQLNQKILVKKEVATAANEQANRS